jgi:hypothetical protein
VFANKNFTAKEMKDINRCRMNLQAFYILDIAGIAGQYIDTWTIKGKCDRTTSSKWEWPIQQRPPVVAWKTWNKAIEEAFIEEEDITHHLCEWYDDGGHQQTEYTTTRKENGSNTRRNNVED